MNGVVKGLWNIVLCGYPRSGKTTLARRIVADYPYFARIGVDELRYMLFNEKPPCRDEFLVYSLIAEIRDVLLEKGYSVVIDSTAPDNATREFLLTAKVKNVNRLIIALTVDRKILIERNVKTFGNADSVYAWDKRWEKPKGDIPIFKFRSNNMKEFNTCYARLKELLASEIHPYKPEFRPTVLTLREIRETLRKFLKRRRV
ncbi:ATP-binding protein [Candidatus Bathyarchaeota archaeon]|nr:MAG: ATP-binding protein [Candidatus Bathyarchaeota archaeon]